MSQTRTGRDTTDLQASTIDELNGPGPDAAEPPKAPIDPVALRAEIELTRAQLADTVAALAAKTDVRTQMRRSVSAASGQVRSRIHDMTGHARQSIGGVGDRMSAMTHSLHRGDHHARQDARVLVDDVLADEPRPARHAAVPADPARRVRPTVATGALGGALVGLVVYLIWRGRR